MTDKELLALKQKIQDEIAAMVQSISHLEEITKPVGTEDMDEITRMDAVLNKSMNDAALSTARKRLAGLEYAMKRIDSPEFGYCLECGEEIPLPRLMAMPETSYCVECAEG